MKTIMSKMNKSGEYDFFYDSKKITGLWMDFFSGLSMEDEKRCVELFIKKYAKKLNGLQ